MTRTHQESVSGHPLTSPKRGRHLRSHSFPLRSGTARLDPVDLEPADHGIVSSKTMPVWQTRDSSSMSKNLADDEAGIAAQALLGRHRAVPYSDGSLFSRDADSVPW